MLDHGHDGDLSLHTRSQQTVTGSFQRSIHFHIAVGTDLTGFLHPIIFFTFHLNQTFSAGTMSSAGSIRCRPRMDQGIQKRSCFFTRKAAFFFYQSNRIFRHFFLPSSAGQTVFFVSVHYFRKYTHKIIRDFLNSYYSFYLSYHTLLSFSPAHPAKSAKKRQPGSCLFPENCILFWCSKNYIMYWGVFTILIISPHPPKVCTKFIKMSFTFCQFSPRHGVLAVEVKICSNSVLSIFSLSINTREHSCSTASCSLTIAFALS